jgi:hypothetical protein
MAWPNVPLLKASESVAPIVVAVPPSNAQACVNAIIVNKII